MTATAETLIQRAAGVMNREALGDFQRLAKNLALESTSPKPETIAAVLAQSGRSPGELRDAVEAERAKLEAERATERPRLLALAGELETRKAEQQALKAKKVAAVEKQKRVTRELQEEVDAATNANHAALYRLGEAQEALDKLRMTLPRELRQAVNDASAKARATAQEVEDAQGRLAAAKQTFQVLMGKANPDTRKLRDGAEKDVGTCEDLLRAREATHAATKAEADRVTAELAAAEKALFDAPPVEPTKAAPRKGRSS